MSKKGTIWISTVLYVLISIAIITIVLTSVKPKIDASRDKITIEQSISLMNELDNAITTADNVVGTRLNREVKVERGSLTIDSSNDIVLWRLEDSAYKYSEPGVQIRNGELKITTAKAGNKWDVTIMIDYRGEINITADSKETSKTFQPAKINYNLFIENNGGGINNINVYSA